MFEKDCLSFDNFGHTFHLVYKVLNKWFLTSYNQKMFITIITGCNAIYGVFKWNFSRHDLLRSVNSSLYHKAFYTRNYYICELSRVYIAKFSKILRTITPTILLCCILTLANRNVPICVMSPKVAKASTVGCRCRRQFRRQKSPM